MKPFTMSAAPAQGAFSPAAAQKPQIENLTVDDLPAVCDLHEQVFGPGRFARTAYRIREDAPSVSPACRKLELGGKLIGAVQMTAVTVGGQGDGMLLGPLAIDVDHANQGHGQVLIAAAISGAESCGVGYVILVGDLPYYERAGFERIPAGQIALPGPVDENRLLIRLLAPNGEIPAGALLAVPKTA